MKPLPELRAIASAATPGPWTVVGRADYAIVLDDDGMWVADVGEAPADALHIAAFSPSTCLELLARLEALSSALAYAAELVLRSDTTVSNYETAHEWHDLARKAGQ